MTTTTAEKHTRVLPATTAYPSEMRTQLWSLCCGAKIISGFKDAHKFTEAELVDRINATLNETPDLQVFAGETINPKLTFLTLNSSQVASEKIMNAIGACGFKLLCTASPRGQVQSFFYLDKSNTFKAAA